MSLQNPLIANEAMYSNEAGDYFYPQTVAKQVIMEDGNRLDAYLGGMVIPNGMELLWENPDPTAEFGNLTIANDNTKYEDFYIDYVGAGSWNIVMTAHGQIGDTIFLQYSGYRNFCRTLEINESGFNVGGAWYYGTYGNSTTTAANTMCIPIRIYGIKENATIGGEGTLLNADMLGGVAAEEYVKKSETGMDLLWENASPTSAFAEQTVTLSAKVTDYKLIFIDGDQFFHPMICKAEVGRACWVTWVSNVMEYKLYRQIYITGEKSIKFNVCIKQYSSTSSETINTELIPVRIFGIK